jgi:hypothetical protein
MFGSIARLMGGHNEHDQRGLGRNCRSGLTQALSGLDEPWAKLSHRPRAK